MGDRIEGITEERLGRLVRDRRGVNHHQRTDGAGPGGTHQADQCAETAPHQNGPGKPGGLGHRQYIAGQYLNVVTARGGIRPTAPAVPAQIEGSNGVAAGEVRKLRGEIRAAQDQP
jgi:hypothetical protein